MKDYKIYGYMASPIMDECPQDINYNVFGLFKKRTIVKGELKVVEYYSDYDESTKTYDNLILKEERDYIRGPQSGFAVKRNMIITWYCYDENGGTVTGCIKETTKYYSIDEAVKEGEKRRDNIIASLKLKMFGLLGAMDAYDLLGVVLNDMNLYRDGNRQVLINTIQTINKAYLDNNVPNTNIAIRDYIVSELSF